MGSRTEDAAPHRPLGEVGARSEFSMQIRVLAFISVFVAGFVAGAAHADAAGDASAEIAKCADIADSAARLKCFDAAAPGQGGFGFPPPQAVTREEDFG